MYIFFSDTTTFSVGNVSVVRSRMNPFALFKLSRKNVPFLLVFKSTKISKSSFEDIRQKSSIFDNKT